MLLNLKGNSEKTVKWREAVLSNIMADKDNVRDFRRVPVTRHHWSLEQLRYFESSNTKPSTPQPRNEVNKRAVFFDEQDWIKDNRKGKLYFHSPNFPQNEVKDIVSGDGRRAQSDFRLASRIEAAHDSVAEEVKSLNVSEFYAMQDKIAELKGALKEMTKEKEKLASELDTVQKEKQQYERQMADAERKKRKRLDNISQDENDEKRMKLLSDEILAMMYNTIQDLGGLCHANLTNEKWYEDNKGSSRILFGFHSYAEMQQCVTTFF